MARNAIALLLDIAPESFDVVIRERLSPEAERVVADALQARAEAVERQKVASEKVRMAVQALAHLGLPQRDIGRLLDVSHQRVGQLSRSVDNNVLAGDPARSRRRATRHS